MDILNNSLAETEAELMRQAKEEKVPVNAVLELLPLCNMDCDMCYVHLDPKEMMQRSSRLHTAREWLQIGQQMKEAGTLFVLLTGGEPLLYPGFREVYLGLQELGMIVTVNTNGTLLNADWADFFAENRPRRINITLYGSDDHAYAELCHYPGGFEKTVKAIRMLKEHHVDVKVSLSLVNKNKEDIPALMDLCDHLGVPFSLDAYMLPAAGKQSELFREKIRVSPETAAEVQMKAMLHSRNRSYIAAYLQNILYRIDHYEPERNRKLSCSAGSCSFAVSWQGYMHLCVIADQPECNVFRDGIRKCWQRLTAVSDQIRTAVKCAQCSRRILCRTCAVSAFLEEGSYDAVPSYCCRYAETLEKLCRHMAAEKI